MLLVIMRKDLYKMSRFIVQHVLNEYLYVKWMNIYLKVYLISERNFRIRSRAN